MRRVNPSRFNVATRGTSREINRSIVLNLVRARQPISRADLASAMGLRRGAVSLIVNDLLAEGLIFEGATGETLRGRRPTLLYIDSRRRSVVAADIRASETYLMLADLVGKPLAGRRELPHRPRPGAAGRPARAPHQGAARRASRDRRLRRHRRGGPGHGGTLDDARAARPDAGLAQRGPARTARVGHGPARANRELGPRLRAGPGLGPPRNALGRRPRLRQRLRRRRRGRHHPRRGPARPAQHRGRVRSRAAVARRPALLVRRERLLGGLHLEPGNAGALLRAQRGRRRPRGRGPTVGHDRGAGRPRPRQRREGAHGRAGDGAVSRPRPRVGDQRPGPRSRVHRRRDHPGVGPDRGHRAIGPRRTGPDLGGRRH